MGKFRKRFTVSIVSLVLVLLLSVGAFSQSAFAAAYDPNEDYKHLDVKFYDDKKPKVDFYINAASRYVLETVPEPDVGSVGGEWSVMGLLRGMYTGCDYIRHINGIYDEDGNLTGTRQYFEDYIERVKAYVAKEEGNLDRNKSTEWSRIILPWTSLGQEITNVAGYDFIEKLSESFNFSKRQGINGPIWEIIAMNTGNYEFYKDDDNDDANTFGKMIDYILKQEIKGGGWALWGNTPDPDITAMALQALAPYYGKEAKYNKIRGEKKYDELMQKIERGIDVLSQIQEKNGGYVSWGSTNSESIAQVIVALTALDIDPLTDKRFIKEGEEIDGVVTDNMVDALLTFWAKDSSKQAGVGGFKHITQGYDGGSGSGTGANSMATDQALYGLIAYARYEKAQEEKEKNHGIVITKPLYDMTDMMHKEYEHMKAEMHKTTLDFGDHTVVKERGRYGAVELPRETSKKETPNEKIQIKSWNTKSDGTGKEFKFKPGEKLYLATPDYDVTVYAQY